MAHNLFNTLQSFNDGSGRDAKFYSLPQLEREGVAQVSRLPISLRVVLESVLRNYDGVKVETRGCGGAGKLEADRRTDGRGSFYGRARTLAGFYRRTIAGRSRRDAL